MRPEVLLMWFHGCESANNTFDKLSIIGNNFIHSKNLYPLSLQLLLQLGEQKNI